MNTSSSPDTFSIYIDALVDLKAVTNTNLLTSYHHGFDKFVVLFCFKHGMCQFGAMQCIDGVNLQYVIQGTCGIREVDCGLQYYDSHMCVWKYFNQDVQETYSQYLLEKEISK